MNLHSSKHTKKNILDNMGCEEENRTESGMSKEAILLSLSGLVSGETDIWLRTK